MFGTLLQGIDLPKLGYVCDDVVPSENATHVVMNRLSTQGPRKGEAPVVDEFLG